MLSDCDIRQGIHLPDIIQKSPKYKYHKQKKNTKHNFTVDQIYSNITPSLCPHQRQFFSPIHNKNLSRRYMYSIDAFGSGLNIQHFKDAVLSILHILHIADDRIRQSEKLAKGV